MAGTHGGKRARAGRKPGIPSGTRTLRVEARAKLAKLVGGSADPLEFVCGLANDPQHDVMLRLEAARTALPYLHPRLSALASVSTTIPSGSDPETVLETVLTRIAKLRTSVIEGVAEVSEKAEPDCQSAGCDKITVTEQYVAGDTILHVRKVSA